LREPLLDAATELFRRQGFVATTVDEVCAAAGATKGAFFHHFPSKEAIAEACLVRWRQQVGALAQRAETDAGANRTARLLAFLDFVIERFSDPRATKSCLAGTTAQEVSETHPKLREAANACFVALENHLAGLLRQAALERKVKLDADSLATLWVAGIQGSILLGKASRDETVIPQTLKHLRAYIAAQLESPSPAPRRPRKR
jgi:TetR/AcrR family transcriptional repressor of nem operon